MINQNEVKAAMIDYVVANGITSGWKEVQHKDLILGLIFDGLKTELEQADRLHIVSVLEECGLNVSAFRQAFEKVKRSDGVTPVLTLSDKTAKVSNLATKWGGKAA